MPGRRQNVRFVLRTSRLTRMLARVESISHASEDSHSVRYCLVIEADNHLFASLFYFANKINSFTSLMARSGTRIVFLSASGEEPVIGFPVCQQAGKALVHLGRSPSRRSL